MAEQKSQNIWDEQGSEELANAMTNFIVSIVKSPEEQTIAEKKLDDCLNYDPHSKTPSTHDKLTEKTAL